MFQKIKSNVISGAKRAKKALLHPGRMQMIMMMLMVGTAAAFAQNTAGDYSAGTTALGTVTTEIAKYVPVVVKLCYAIAGVVAVVGAISVYIKMNNEEQDVKNFLLLFRRNEIKGRIMTYNTLYIKTILQRLRISDCFLLSP